MEILKDIKGYEGLYQASSEGYIYSLKTATKLKPTWSRDKRYHKVTLYKDRVATNFRIHRLIAGAFIANPENKPCVNHKDGNKLNNCLPNLEWCTVDENNLHAKEIGLLVAPIGEKNGMSKLTSDKVREIRKLTTLSNTKIAEMFNVSRRAINAIRNYKRWAHI